MTHPFTTPAPGVRGEMVWGHAQPARRQPAPEKSRRQRDLPVLLCEVVLRGLGCDDVIPVLLERLGSKALHVCGDGLRSAPLRFLFDLRGQLRHLGLQARLRRKVRRIYATGAV